MMEEETKEPRQLGTLLTLEVEEMTPEEIKILMAFKEERAAEVARSQVEEEAARKQAETERAARDEVDAANNASLLSSLTSAVLEFQRSLVDDRTVDEATRERARAFVEAAEKAGI